MFSIFKKATDEQEVVLQDLTEEQLTQAAGGRDHGRNWDSHKKWMKHHKHHHHHQMNKRIGSHNTWSSDKARNMTFGGGYNGGGYNGGGHW